MGKQAGPQKTWKSCAGSSPTHRQRIDVAYLAHQPAVFDSTARHVVYVKGRRAGGTYGAVLRLVELARQRPGSRHLWVDTVQRNIARYVGRYFAPLLRGTPWRWDAAALCLTFPWGSTCDFGSAQHPERLAGFVEGWVALFRGAVQQVTGFFADLLGPDTILGKLAGLVGISVAGTEAPPVGTLARRGAEGAVVPGAARAISNVASSTDNSRRLAIGRVNVTSSKRLDGHELIRQLQLAADG